MAYTTIDIDKIVSCTKCSVQKKQDYLLKFDCNMYCNLGSASTKTAKDEVKRTSRRIYAAIKKINPTIGRLLLQTMDSPTDRE